MEPDDLLCSRNARPPKALVGRAQWKINQPPSLKRERASLEGACISFDARSEGQPGRYADKIANFGPDCKAGSLSVELPPAPHYPTRDI